MSDRPNTGHTDSFARLQAAFAQFRAAFSRIEESFGRRWEGWAVVLLTESLRKAELTRMIVSASGKYIHPNQVGRVLKDLINDGVVLVDTDVDGHTLYGLTQSGRDRARYLHRLAGVDNDPPEQPAHDKGGAANSSSDVARFADQWRHALNEDKPIQLTHGECSQVLRLLTSDVFTAATAATFDPDQTRAIGAHLFTAGFIHPSALGSTLFVIATQLPPLLTLHRPESAIRTTRLVEHIAIGWARAMRDRALDEHEAFQRVVLSARYAGHTARETTEAPNHQPARARHQATPRRRSIWPSAQLDTSPDARTPRPSPSGADPPTGQAER